MGYIASRRNLINNGWVVIYEAALQGLDIDGGKKYEKRHTIRISST